MAASILHFGQELSYCFPFLRKAGYSVNRHEKIIEFRQALQSGVGHHAVSLCEHEGDESRLAVLAARTYSAAPLILFRRGRVIPFRAGDSKPPVTEENARSNFDLVIHTDTSPWTWLSDIDRLIARHREVIDKARRSTQMSVLVRQGPAAVTEKNRFERQRGESESPRDATMVASPAALVDRTLVCTVCSAEFEFTVGEQLFFRLRNFVNDPKHCKKCRSIRRTGTASTSKETSVTCAGCGISTTVPFKAFRGEPVWCRSCFEKNRNAG